MKSKPHPEQTSPLGAAEEQAAPNESPVTMRDCGMFGVPLLGSHELHPGLCGKIRQQLPFIRSDA